MEHQFKKGDKVKVLSNDHRPRTYFDDLGQVGRITSETQYCEEYGWVVDVFLGGISQGVSLDNLELYVEETHDLEENKWYKHHGTECPCHPEDMVETWRVDYSPYYLPEGKGLNHEELYKTSHTASEIPWENPKHNCQVVAFRIIKKYKSETTYDFGDGNGPVPAHKHPNGGGWVANSASVSEDCYVDPCAKVFGNVRVTNGVRLFCGSVS